MKLITLRTLAVRLARPDITFWVLPLLMILLVAGTIAQKDIGLYAAHKSYFASLITFIGPIPFPGAYVLITILFINLLMKFLLFSEWSWQKSGIILTHFSVLLLMIGGLFTALTQKEGYMVIEENQTSNTINDYQQRQLMIVDDKNNILLSVPYQDLNNGKIIQSSVIPFQITLEKYCFNCAITKRDIDDQKDFHGAGKFMKLNTTAPELEYEMNVTGVEFRVKSAGKFDGRYVTFDKFPKPPQITVNDKNYTIVMGREQRKLPFSLTLNDFSRTVYPGTSTASGYESKLNVQDEDQSWPTIIRMNEPFRYRGYTFYQSSFEETPQGVFTVLSVVENKGRLFPYIATFLMTFGLLLHCVLRMKRDGGPS